jgi:hypothetical protein
MIPIGSASSCRQNHRGVSQYSLSNSRRVYSTPPATKIELSEDDKAVVRMGDVPSDTSENSKKTITGVKHGGKKLLIYGDEYTIFSSHHPDVLHTLQAIPGDIHNFRLICKASDDGSEPGVPRHFLLLTSHHF